MKNRFKLKLSQKPLLSTVGVMVGTTIMFTSTPLLADEVELTLKNVDIVEQKISDTKPVEGYNATYSTSATRTETPLLDTPQSITVITEDTIKDLSVQNMSEAVQYVPGVQGAQGEGNRDAIIFRGNQSTSDLYVDGMRDDVQIYRDLYNSQTVEVIKGANSMVSGRGGAGGIINRVTKEAGWDPVSQIGLTYGAYNQKRATVDYGKGITDDIAFRINGVYEDADSYRSNVDLKRFGINPTITIKPNDATKITFGVEYFKDERVTDRGVPSVSGTKNIKNRPYNLEDYSRFFGNPNFSPTESEVFSINAMIEHTFDNGLKLRNRTRFANYNKFYQNVYASGPVTNAGTIALSAYRDETDRENLINQTDLIYTLNTGAIEHKLLAGMELTSQDNENRRLTSPVAVNGVTLANSISSQALVLSNVARNQTTDVSVFGVYLQDQIKFNSQWQAIVGVRHDDVDMDYKDLNAATDTEINDNLFSPRAGLIFKPVEPVSLYANYSLTKTPRTGDQLVSLRGNLDRADFKPEEFINKEIGAKWDINPRLALNAAIYKLERENVLTADPNDANNNILVDGQETKGFELSLSGAVTNKWSILAALTLQDGKLTETVGSSDAGSKLANTPTRSLSVWNKYQINNVWAVALGVISVSERYAALPTTTASTIMPGYTRYDAAVFAKLNDKLKLQLNVENLTDKAYALYGHNRNNITPGAPLTGRATLIYDF